MSRRELISDVKEGMIPFERGRRILRKCKSVVLDYTTNGMECFR